MVVELCALAGEVAHLELLVLQQGRPQVTLYEVRPAVLVHLRDVKRTIWVMCGSLTKNQKVLGTCRFK